MTMDWMHPGLGRMVGGQASFPPNGGKIWMW